MFTALRHSLSGDLGSKAEATEVNRENATPEKKSPAPRTLLSGPTITYSVQANDTLMSIAARFDTTPSELTKMNRLSTRFLFPGQLLSVPDKGGSKENLSQDLADKNLEECSNKESQSSPILSDLAPPSLQSSSSSYPRTPANSVETDKSLDKECLEKFLKIQVRHITDGQGVVAGVLLVTPNAVMFDPNVSDPLVIERGSESYGVIAPMDLVVNAALFYDIAHMKVKDTTLPKPDIPKPEIYFGPMESSSQTEEDEASKQQLLLAAMRPSEESPSKEGLLPELTGTSQDNDNDSSCSCGGETRETSAFPKAFEHELLTPISGDDPSPSSEVASNITATSTNVHQTTTVSTANVQQSNSPSVTSTNVQQVVGDLATIAEDSISSKAAQQTQCDNTVVPPEAQQLQPQKIPLRSTLSAPIVNDNNKKRTTSVTFSTSSESDMPPLFEDGSEAPCQETRKQKVLKRISYPLSWMENLGTEKDSHGGQQIPSSAPTSGTWTSALGSEDAKGQPGMFSNVFNMSNVSNMLTRRPSLDLIKRPVSYDPLLNPCPPPSGSQHGEAPQEQKRAQFKEGPKFGLKSMVSLDDMPDLFASFDKLIPKPASASEESPLYLCLRMGKPIEKSIPRTTPIMTYGKKIMKPEYWFSIPKNRSEELYHFFQIWAQELYGEVDEECIKKRGFILIDEELEIVHASGTESGHEEIFGGAGELKEMTKESWEVVAMSEELRRALYSSSSLTSLDIEVFLPEIQGNSEIIDDDFRKNMFKKLPARVQGYNWKLIFNTSQHGFSLKSLYRKMHGIETPIILFIQDTQQNKFGALLSCPLKVSELFYGTGESFLFMCQPEFKIFQWTGENNFFAKGNFESLYIGGGDGNFGIWLDGDLYQGRSQPCQTFGNPVLSDNEDFIIKAIECWYFD